MGSMDDTWKTLFNEHTRAPIYTVSHYIAYLRRFVADTSAASSTGSSGSSGADKKEEKRRREASSANKKKSGATEGIDPLSYFLRKLKLDLKVSYDSFVRDFVSPQNEGLRLLLQLLNNLQSPSASGAVSRSSPSPLNTSTSPLDDYKKAVTDEYDCLLCIKFCLRVQSGASQLMELPDGLHRIATGVQGSSSKARITCLEILTLCLQLDRRGVERVVEAFTLVRLHTGQSVRFKMLVSMLHTRSPSQVLFQVTCLKFFNTLLNACPSANQRVYLQHELLSAGLDLQFLAQCADGDGLEYDDLKREIDDWKTRFIDVDALLKRLKERDGMGGLFWGQEGPVQVSSRVSSLRASSHGVTYFQPEELAGTVQLEYRRGLPNTSRHQASNGPVIPTQQPHANADAPGLHDNGGAEADDSDSDFISVSAQHTPHFRRKHVTQTYSRQINGGPDQNHSTRTSQNFHRESSQFHSPDHPSQTHGFSNGVIHEQAGNDHSSAALQRRHSVESFVDAYGLVIHSRDRPRDSPQRHQEPPSAYSNFKLRYFSTPNIPSRTSKPGHHQGDSRDQDGVVTNGQDAGKVEKCVSQKNDDDVIWNTYYPFSKRAFYRGLDSSAERLNTTLPVRAIHSPPTLDTKTTGLKNDKSSLTPLPDYTPVQTPRGSTRSLNAEVARVLHEFENTLRAHEPSRSPPSTDLGPVAFV